MAKQESRQQIKDHNDKWEDDPKSVDRFEVGASEKRDGKVYIQMGDEFFELEGETIFSASSKSEKG